MDLVEYDEGVYLRIQHEFLGLIERLNLPMPIFVPLSALRGDNVVNRSENMAWYSGLSLLDSLNVIEPTLYGAKELGLLPESADALRLPVQCVIRPNQDYRGFAGTIESGSLSIGDRVVALPSNRTAIVTSLRDPDGEAQLAGPGMPVTITLDEDIDLSRGDLIVSSSNRPEAVSSMQAHICWFDDLPLQLHARYLLRHTTRLLSASVSKIVGKLDVAQLEIEPSDGVGLNDIAEVKIHLAQPIFPDLYADNRYTGSFILIDPHSHRTVAAGMINVLFPTETSPHKVVKGEIYWLRNVASEKLDEIRRKLGVLNTNSIVLDDESLHLGINADQPTEEESLRRQIEIARLLSKQGLNVIVWSHHEPPRSLALAPVFLDLNASGSAETESQLESVIWKVINES